MPATILTAKYSEKTPKPKDLPNESCYSSYDIDPYFFVYKARMSNDREKDLRRAAKCYELEDVHFISWMGILGIRSRYMTGVREWCTRLMDLHDVTRVRCGSSHAAKPGNGIGNDYSI